MQGTGSSRSRHAGGGLGETHRRGPGGQPLTCHLWTYPLGWTQNGPASAGLAPTTSMTYGRETAGAIRDRGVGTGAPARVA